MSNAEFGFRSCAVIVAHPDDETLWAGGTILMHPQSKWTIVTLCRKSDPDRAPRFTQAIKALNATGRMGDLDDSPEQAPLDEVLVQNTICDLLGSQQFDLIITHHFKGEYTRHHRHEETAKAVNTLRQCGRLDAKNLWMFAYEDGQGKYLPRPIENADLQIDLPQEVWHRKYELMTKIYGFGPDTFEAKTTPRREAFWCFEQTSRRTQSEKE
jgi:LmbE family N-acetylglucosaminyl deacetylase